MRLLLMAASFLAAAACSTVAANADVITIGHATFDFDAPSAPLTPGQQALVEQYRDAINRHDEAALMSLQDGSMNNCAVVSRKSILQNLAKSIPDDAKVRFFAATEDIAKDLGFGDLAYLSTQPTAVLGIAGGTKSEHQIKIVTILRPVREVGDTVTLIPYCLTEKGRALFESEDAGRLGERK
jgi:hypothetical protein